MDPEQAPRRERGIKKSESIVLEILRGAINGVCSSNAASKSRMVRPSVPSRRRNRIKSKSVSEAIGLASLRVSNSRDVQTLAVSSPIIFPWALVPFVPVGHASTCAVSGLPTFT